MTARGRGTWGENRYDVELVRNEVTRTTSDASRSCSTTYFDLLIGDPAGGYRRFETEAERVEHEQQALGGWLERPRDPDAGHVTEGSTRFGADKQAVGGSALTRRRFESADARTKFVEKWLRELRLEPIDPPEQRERDHPLASLVGHELELVEFVRDWMVQLGFDDQRFNIYLRPPIHQDRTILGRDQAGYADALVGQIGVVLKSVDELLDQGLVLDFANGVRLVIPLDGSETEGHEAAEFGSAVWAGDEAIAWSAPDSSGAQNRSQNWSRDQHL